ncbi:MAG TPA: 3-hydroxyacyl-ACP dehydratase FabZ family protein [Planctomycetaceae bacterium]|nr:3-hydroxyacyl-ACP dehydratase FabZ family protein [Planctomycetaceae bacterium]
MRFSLIDRITDLDARTSVAAVKNLTLAEEYLADHFPGFPVMPGVLMLEALVQSAAWLMRFTEDFKYSTVLLKQARAVRFNSFVTPGRTLVIGANVHDWGAGTCTFKATGTVDGTSAISARLTLEQFNLADRNAELAASDEKRRQAMRGLFAQLWRPAEGQ